MRYLSRHETMARLGHPGYHRLFPHLLEWSGVEPVRIGRMTGIAETDLPKLRAALKRWRDRPRLSRTAN